MNEVEKRGGEKWKTIEIYVINEMDVCTTKREMQFFVQFFFSLKQIYLIYTLSTNILMATLYPSSKIYIVFCIVVFSVKKEASAFKRFSSFSSQ